MVNMKIFPTFCRGLVDSITECAGYSSSAVPDPRDNSKY
jgi:hypothetical protein